MRQLINVKQLTTMLTFVFDSSRCKVKPSFEKVAYKSRKRINDEPIKLNETIDNFHRLYSNNLYRLYVVFLVLYTYLINFIDGAVIIFIYINISI